MAHQISMDTNNNQQVFNLLSNLNALMSAQQNQQNQQNLNLNALSSHQQLFNPPRQLSTDSDTNLDLLKSLMSFKPNQLLNQQYQQNDINFKSTNRVANNNNVIPYQKHNRLMNQRMDDINLELESQQRNFASILKKLDDIENILKKLVEDNNKE